MFKIGDKVRRIKAYCHAEFEGKEKEIFTIESISKENDVCLCDFKGSYYLSRFELAEKDKPLTIKSFKESRI